jgi:alginate O-acetyltransferase complex protein AlgI
VTLPHILVFTLVALLTRWLLPRHWRPWFLLGASLVAIYWLQPSTPIRNLDFWLPTTSLILTVFVWAVTRSKAQPGQLANQTSVLIIIGALLLVALTRYAGPLCCLTATRPPPLPLVFLGLLLAASLAAVPYLLPFNRALPAAAIALILGLFVTLKSEPLARQSSAWLRSLAGQSPDLASSLDLPWLGFSYLAFRLLHVLRDYQMGRLPAYTLGEFVTYAIFFPTYVAGPIDRSQRFVNDLRNLSAPDSGAEKPQKSTHNLIQGSWRILLGVFKKFVLADSLALFALSDQNAVQTNSTLWTWVLLYAFAFRLYFDFSGYTDVAIGLGRLIDFRLPENFDRPYLKQSLIAFWNSWHMTLAQWFRAYFFNPLTRALRTRPRQLPMWSIILVGQFSTMALIGLWHGITWNYFLWGAWHGLGLFVNNRYSDWARIRLNGLSNRPRLEKVFSVGSWLITFHFITLGWVWFALSSPALAWNVFLRLFGI